MYQMTIERISMECCKGKTKASPTANRNKLKVKTNELPEAREYTGYRVAIGFSFGQCSP